MCPKLNVNVVFSAYEEEMVPDTCLVFSRHTWEMVRFVELYSEGDKEVFS